MRRWLLIALVLFMPLRGMAADAMGVAMALAPAAVAHAPAAAHPEAHAASQAHADCADHLAMAGAAAPADAHAEQAQLPDDNCPSCTSCMVCASAALVVQSGLPEAVATHHAVPAAAGPDFHSVALRRGFKPPIS